MTQVAWSEAAKADLDEIWLYVAQDSIDAADRLIEALVGIAEPLKDFPLMGFDRSELSPHLRALRTGNYILFYRSLPGKTRIERVLHTRRDITADYF